MPTPIVYNQKNWQDGVAGGTPITEAELDRMEAGIAAAVAGVNAATTGVVASPSNLKLTVATSAPTSPVDGDIWLNSSDVAAAQLSTGPAWATTPSPWQSSVTYTAGPPASVVTYNGSAYFALASSLGVTPGTDGTKWLLLAQGGTSTGGTSSTATSSSWHPADGGLLGWTYDPISMGNGSAITAGVACYSQLKVAVTGALTTVQMYCTTAAVSNSNCYVAVYRGTTLLAQSADLSASWQTTGVKSAGMPRTPAVTAGDLLTVIFWCGAATTMPGFGRAGNGFSAVNAGPTWSVAGQGRYGTTGAGLTTAAPSPLGSLANSSSAYWVGIY